MTLQPIIYPWGSVWNGLLLHVKGTSFSESALVKFSFFLNIVYFTFPTYLPTSACKPAKLVVGFPFIFIFLLNKFIQN